MCDSFLGEISFFAFDRIPKGWLPCDGRALDISKYTALYSLIGNAFDGKPTVGKFKLPDLCGRTPIGLFNDYSTIKDNRVVDDNGQIITELGISGGKETVVITEKHIPGHTHYMSYTTTNPPVSGALSGALLSMAQRASSTPVTAIDPGNTYGPPDSTIAINPASLSSAGKNAPHENRQPYLVLLACICVEGLYPPRS